MSTPLSKDPDIVCFAPLRCPGNVSPLYPFGRPGDVSAWDGSMPHAGYVLMQGFIDIRRIWGRISWYAKATDLTNGDMRMVDLAIDQRVWHVIVNELRDKPLIQELANKIVVMDSLNDCGALDDLTKAFKRQMDGQTFIRALALAHQTNCLAVESNDEARPLLTPLMNSYYVFVNRLGNAQRFTTAGLRRNLVIQVERFGSRDGMAIVRIRRNHPANVEQI